jgi:Ca-activated chloride channel homolog
VTGLRFLAPQMLAMLWVVPVAALLLALGARLRRSALGEFAHPAMEKLLLAGTDPVGKRWRTAMLLGACALLAVSLARPGWNPQPRSVQHLGRDVVFLVDVSRSMLAEDLKPNRLSRAKFAILDTVDDLQGDRVGLIAFAGTAALKCPLTHDYGFFRMMVEGLSPDSIARGGTLLGDALRAASLVFRDEERRYKDIVLITDGEDHESFPVEAAGAAGELGIRLIVIGLGSEEKGTRIPITDDSGRERALTYQGREVLSRLDSATLRSMAAATPGGRYFNVSTGTVDLADIYRNIIRREEKTRLASESVLRYDEKFQLFLLPAVLLLCAEMAMSARVTIRRRRNP